MKEENLTPKEESISLLGERDLAKRLAVSVAFLRKLRRLRRGPRFLKLGHAVRYRASDIAEWLSARAVATAGQTSEQ